jgi:hypothetical protein
VKEAYLACIVQYFLRRRLDKKCHSGTPVVLSGLVMPVTLYPVLVVFTFFSVRQIFQIMQIQYYGLNHISSWKG